MNPMARACLRLLPRLRAARQLFAPCFRPRPFAGHTWRQPGRRVASQARRAAAFGALLPVHHPCVGPTPRPVRGLASSPDSHRTSPPQLNAQVDTTQQQASACAAGGAILPYNPAWAPFPVHAWPDAGTKPCEQMQAHATYIQQENAQAVTQLAAQMNQASPSPLAPGCLALAC